ncbi:MAG: biopolymer transporter ExbD [Verrucomicrobia bacterium]|nr:biopolymer transporter ExbD [Verrucomicrobiota bacterium]
MQFCTRKRRQQPAVIIVSLIDVLMVVLIFLMVSTTFKQQPAVKLALPESNQSKGGATETPPIVVTIAKQPPHLYLDTTPVTLDKLQEELLRRAAQKPDVALSIRADAEAPFGQIIKVMDAAKAAKIKAVSAFTKNPGQP